MGDYTRRTRRWLDERFRRCDAEGVYQAHQPVYGLGDPHSEPKHLPRLARTLHVLRAMNRIAFDTVLDVGGGEGYLTCLAGELFGARGVSADLSVEAGRRARELFGVQGVALDSARLPFPDGAFDLVVSSEVLEHVEHPIEMLLELLRVARRAVILTTEECETDRDEVERMLFERSGYLHSDRNVFHPDDLRAVLGDDVSMRSQYTGDFPMEPLPREEARAWLVERTAPMELVEGGHGVVLVALRDPGARRDPRYREADLVERLLDFRREPRPLEQMEHAPLAEHLLDRMVSPTTGEPLAYEDGVLLTPSGLRHEVRAGVPVLYDESLPDPTREETRERLLALFGAGARAEAVLALRDALELPPPSDRRIWDFARREERRGWSASEDLVSRDDAGAGCFSWRTAGSAAYVVSPRLGLRAREIASIELELAARPAPGAPAGGVAVGRIHWMAESDASFTESNSLLFPSSPDGTRREQVLQVRGRSGWPLGEERILWIRVDFLSGGSSIPLDVDFFGCRLLEEAPRESGAGSLTWDFSRASDRSAWQVNGELEPRAAGPDGLHWTCRGTDPWLVTAVTLPAGAAIEAVEVTMSVHNPAYGTDEGDGQIYWMGEADVTFDERRSAGFRLRNDGEPHTYRISLADRTAWPQDARHLWLRLDPCNGPAAVSVYRVELVGSHAP